MSKYHVQFFSKDLLDCTVEAMGDRSILFVDGRCSQMYHMRWAEEHAAKYKYVAYQIRRGSIRDYISLTEIINVRHEHIHS